MAIVGPIAVGIDAADGDFMSYTNGIYSTTECQNDFDSLDHAVTVVGYGTENGKDY